jgi:molecular chaperone DnaK
MEKMINYGIDLGTTNSAIAKFVKGEVEVFKNPLETGKKHFLLLFTTKKTKLLLEQMQEHTLNVMQKTYSERLKEKWALPKVSK